MSRFLQVQKLLDWDDLDHVKLRSQIDSDPWPGIRGGMSARLMLTSVQGLCLDSADSYDHVWVTRAEDALSLPAASASVRPNIPFPSEGEEIGSQTHVRRDILFIGNLTYLLNSDGLTRFAERIWPRIRTSHPGARILATGPPPEPDVP